MLNRDMCTYTCPNTERNQNCVLLLGCNCVSDHMGFVPKQLAKLLPCAHACNRGRVIGLSVCLSVSLFVEFQQ